MKVNIAHDGGHICLFSPVPHADTVTHYIAKDSLPMYTHGCANAIFTIKRSYGSLARETSDWQPTNASRVGSVACSVRAKRRKMEGAHRDSNLFYYCLY